MVVLGGVAFSYERGTPVGVRARALRWASGAGVWDAVSYFTGVPRP